MIWNFEIENLITLLNHNITEERLLFLMKIDLKFVIVNIVLF